MMSFMVFVEGKQGPTREHATEAEARAEAERLAQANDGKRVWVLAVVDVLEPIRGHRWREALVEIPQPGPIVIPAPPVSPFAPHQYPPQYPGPPMPDVVYYGCQTPPLGGVVTDTSSDVKWYGEEADNDD